MIHLVEGDTRRMNTHARSIIDNQVADINAPRQVEAYELVPVEAMDRIRAFHAEVATALAASDAVEGPVEWGPDLDDSWNALPNEVKP